MKTILFVVLALALVACEEPVALQEFANGDGPCNAPTVTGEKHYDLEIQGSTYCIAKKALEQVGRVKEAVSKSLLSAERKESDNTLVVTVAVETNDCEGSNCFEQADSLFKVEVFDKQPVDHLSSSTFASTTFSYTQGEILDNDTIFEDKVGSDGVRTQELNIVISFAGITTPAHAKIAEQTVTVDVTVQNSPNVIGYLTNVSISSSNVDKSTTGTIEQQLATTFSIHNDNSFETAPDSITVGQEVFFQLQAQSGVVTRNWDTDSVQLFLVVDQAKNIEIELNANDIANKAQVDLDDGDAVNNALRFSATLKYLGTFLLKVKASTIVPAPGRRALDGDVEEVTAFIPVTILPKEQPSYSVFVLSAVAAVLLASSVLLYSRNRKLQSYKHVESNDIKV